MTKSTIPPAPTTEPCLCGDCAGDGFDMFPHKPAAPPERVSEEKAWPGYVSDEGDETEADFPAARPAVEPREEPNE